MPLVVDVEGSGCARLRWAARKKREGSGDIRDSDRDRKTEEAGTGACLAHRWQSKTYSVCSGNVEGGREKQGKTQTDSGQDQVPRRRISWEHTRRTLNQPEFPSRFEFWNFVFEKENFGMNCVFETWNTEGFSSTTRNPDADTYSIYHRVYRVHTQTHFTYRHRPF